MTAYMLSPCYCTSSTCCDCRGVQYGGNFYVYCEPVPSFAEQGVLAQMLKTWRIWTAWKRELPVLRDVLLPTFDLLPSILRPRTRERRHVQGHSPRCA